MKNISADLLLLLCLVCADAALAGVLQQEKADLEVESRIVRYLQEHVKPGEPVVVSDLYNNVFKTPGEQKVLNRLFNTFFKIPLFVAQYKATTNQIPTLADISRQFNLRVPGEAAVLLSIIESDPRVPAFLTRNPATGEITSVDIDAIKKDPKFGQVLERTLAGWVGRESPAFAMTLFDGKPLSSAQLKGKAFLLYFWFSGCPPCARIAPHLVQLQNKYGGADFTVVAANTDRFLELDVTDAQRDAYVRKHGFNFPVGHVSRKMQEDFGAVNVYPTLFLVDRTGVIRKYYVNYQAFDVLQRDVETVLSAGAAE
jgi:thiol-disulfide isomerase/thioredoxin